MVEEAPTHLCEVAVFYRPPDGEGVWTRWGCAWWGEGTQYGEFESDQWSRENKEDHKEEDGWFFCDCLRVH